MTDVDLSQPRRIHLVGIGGAGMSGIARMLVQRGHAVSGSDRQESRTLERLRALGTEIRVGHDATAVQGADIVVRSSAIPDDNPELAAAREASMPLLHRSEMLAALMRGSRAVLVSGTHGKTTTTSMAVVALQAAGTDPSFAIGGALNEAGSNAHAGSGDLFVAEADESDRSFLSYRPDLAIVTNVGLDHTDAFTGIEDAVASFSEFLARRTEDAPALVCLDDEGSARLAATAPRVVTFGEDPRADLRLVVENGEAGVRPELPAQLRAEGSELVSFSIGMPGRHNLLNAAAALGACHLLGVDLDAAAEGLRTFQGPLRRFQRLGSARGVEVIDDYAHNPTKLRATLAAARAVTDGRIVLVVQPHLYSRTQALGEELGRAAAGADVVVVTDVYGAREDPIPGVTGEIVATAAREAGANVTWIAHLTDVAPALADLVRPGDLVVVTGAGDVNQVGPALLGLLGD